MKKGFTLIEILVVISIFAILAAIAAQAVAYSLRGAKKADSSSDVRDSLDFAVSIIERQLRNSQGIASTCDGTTELAVLDYLDQDEVNSTFSCVDVAGPDSHVASGSARLTNDSINISECYFVCTQASAPSLPPTVDIHVKASKRDAKELEQASATIDTTVNLRFY